MGLVFELLSNNEIGIALEFICDKLAENNTILSEILGLRLQFVATHLNLNPAKTWEGLIIEDKEYHQIKRMFREGVDIGSSFETIFQNSYDLLTAVQVKWIEEFYDHDEFDLAFDCLCCALIDNKIPVSRVTLNMIKTILLDLGRNPEEWKGFFVKDE